MSQSIDRVDLSHTFVENIVRATANYVVRGSFYTGDDLKTGVRISADGPPCDDDEDNDECKCLTVTSSGCSTVRYFVDTLQSKRIIDFSFVLREESEVEPQHTNEGFASGLGTLWSSSISPCKIPVPEKTNPMVFELEPDSHFRAVYHIATKTLFVIWQAPSVRETCVATFILPDSIIDKLHQPLE